MTIEIKNLGLVDYQQTWEAMQNYTQTRNERSSDQLWLLQHPAVYTQGQAGKPEHILNPKSIPIVQSDRGGQVTYHGPGQIVAYVLVDLKRKGLGIRALVSALENSVINCLKNYHIDAASRCDAPGVYVKEQKICSIGLRVKKGCTYHGIALNVDMDLNPFLGINPCGFKRLEMTKMSAFNASISLSEVTKQLSLSVLEQLSYQ